ncbi:hypothetical protein, partial [Escherichia coli]|uniref:hypothetical protein n=1 Tax=Escherichia coli TaxID=562 RepID=UPI003F7F0182
MGLKTAPAAFQGLVAHCLADAQAKPYIDDVLLGTPLSEGSTTITDACLQQHDMALRELFDVLR